MKTKHTPGPWKINPKNEIEASTDRHQLNLRISQFTPAHRIDHEEANAKLIAESPAMLQQLDSDRMAMKITLAYFKDNNLTDWIDMIEAVIINIEEIIIKATS